MQIQSESLSTEQQLKRINLFVETVGKNKYIPHKPFIQQFLFLTYESEELLYGGQAGGGKSDALLMSALQYVDYPNYSALLLRRTYQDLSQPNAIMDRAKKWLNPYTKTGEVHWNNQTKTFTFPSGATLSFGYLSHDNDLDQYQGSELQFVGFDELTQFTEKQYTYLHSRLRKLENSAVPIRMRAGTNPGGRGHDWVKKRFITDDSPQPFIQSAYTDNIHLDTDQYGKQLDKLDELTRLQLKNGDWDATITSGLLVNRTQLEKQIINPADFEGWTPTFCTIGVDPASTGEDKFAMSCLVYFDNGNIVLMDLDATPSAQPEEKLKLFIERNQQWNPYIINFEGEAGSSPLYALRYWQSKLDELSHKYGFIVSNTKASSMGSKYTRAVPHANLIRQGKLYFNKSIDTYYGTYNPLRTLFNQYIYIHPDKSVMNDYPSPDELDSVGYAFTEIQNVVRV